jgi:hypothetical protein
MKMSRLEHLRGRGRCRPPWQRSSGPTSSAPHPHDQAHSAVCTHALLSKGHCSRALLIVQRRQHSVMLSQHHDLSAKPPALGNAAKILPYPPTKENMHWRPWYDCAPHAPKILYSVCPGPLFLYQASTLCQSIHMLRDQTGLSSFYLLDRNGYSRRFSPGAKLNTQAGPHSESPDLASEPDQRRI